MKIVIATGIFPPQIGGPATYSKLLLEVLPGHGHQVTVINFGDLLWLPKGVRHVVYAVKLFVQALKADLIYAQDPVSVGLPSLWVSRLTKRPLLLKIVGDYAWEQASQRYGVTDPLDVFCRQTAPYSFFIKRLKKIQTKVARGAKLIIVPSNYLKSVVSAWGIAPEKITVIYNGHQAPVVTETEDQLKASLGLSAPVLLSVGRLVPWKGFAALIEIMPEIARKFAGAKLYIAGEGPQLAVLQEKAQGAPVIFLGRLDQTTLFQYIKAADIFILNTAYEGFSHQLLEVMALGTPIITTDAGGNTELIENEKTGLLFSYNDKRTMQANIEKLLTDKASANQLAQNGLKKVAQFTDTAMIERLLKVLTQFQI